MSCRPVQNPRCDSVASLRDRDDGGCQAGDGGAIQPGAGDQVVDRAHIFLAEKPGQCRGEGCGSTGAVRIAHRCFQRLHGDPETSALVTEQPSPSAADDLLTASGSCQCHCSGARDETDPPCAPGSACESRKGIALEGEILVRCDAGARGVFRHPCRAGDSETAHRDRAPLRRAPHGLRNGDRDALAHESLGIRFFVMANGPTASHPDNGAVGSGQHGDGA